MMAGSGEAVTFAFDQTRLGFYPYSEKYQIAI